VQVRVLVFEQWKGGHYINYLEFLIPKFADLASELILSISPSLSESREFQRLLPAWSRHTNIRIDSGVDEANPTLPWQDRLTVLGNLRDSIRRHRPDYVFVPSADAQNLALGLLGPFSCGALSLGAASECILHWGYGPGSMHVKNRMKRATYNASFVGSPWGRLNFVNFLLYEAMRKTRQGGRVALVPDPVPQPPLLSKAEGRALLKLPVSGRVIGFIGSMDGRKAIPEFLRAFRRARLRSDDRLVLAGTLAPEFAAYVRSEYADLQQQDRLILIDRWLTEEELLGGYSAFDVVCLPYYQFPGLSSLMLKAMAAHRPVLVHDFGWMRAIARRFRAADVCNINDIADFSAAIEGSLDRSEEYRFTPAVRALIDYHDPGNFSDHCAERLQAISGKPAPPLARTWERVMEELDPQFRNAY
jgi:glycosyltransferase involved in cell wall biosynthesis